jgi:putative transcriptional regulator
MPTNTKSAASSPSSRPKHSPFGRRLIGALNEAVAHARGKISLTEYRVTVPDTVDVAALRERLGLSQAGFARAFGLDLGAVQAWEQHRRRPDRTARILLAVIAREPGAVMRALAA